jgi:hypothetical protein
MQIENVSYHKVFNLGNYSNEKIGIDIRLAPGEDPIEAFAEAKKIVEKSHQFFQDQPHYDQAKEIVSRPDDFTGRQVKQAEEAIKAFEANYPDYMLKFVPASRQLTQAPMDADYEPEFENTGNERDY